MLILCFKQARCTYFYTENFYMYYSFIVKFLFFSFNFVCMQEWDAEFQMVISMSNPDHTAGALIYPCLEEVHIFTLANIIRRPIIVIAHDTLRGPAGHSIQPLHVAGIYLPVLWDPSLCFKHPVVLGFYQNHFSRWSQLKEMVLISVFRLHLQGRTEAACV